MTQGNEDVGNLAYTDTDEEIQRYGLFLLRHNMVNIGISLVIGLIFGCVRECLVFTIAYIGLRRYMGGYHAPKASVCVVMSIAMLSIVSVLAHLLEPSVEISIVVILVYLALYMRLPIETKNRALDVIERDIFRRISVSIMVIYIIVALILIEFGWLYNCIMYAIICCECLSLIQVLLSLCGKIRRKSCGSPFFEHRQSTYSSD